MDHDALTKKLRANIEILSENDKPTAIFAYVDSQLGRKRYDDELYPLVKKMIDLAIDSYDHKKYGYDQINVEKFIGIIDRFPPMECLGLLTALRQKLLQSGIETDYYYLNNKIQSTRYQTLKTGVDKYYLIKKIVYFPTISGRNLAISLVAIFLLLFIVLLPSPFPKWATFEYEGYHYEDLLSHMTFTFNVILSASDDIGVTPINLLGTIQIGLVKIFALAYGATFIVEEFKKRVNHI